MSDRLYLNAQTEMLESLQRHVSDLKAIAAHQAGTADDFDYSFAAMCSAISDINEFSISTAGFTGLTDMERESFMYNLCSRAAIVFNAPHARFCFGGTSLSMLMLVGKILPDVVRDKRRTIVLADDQGHQSLLGGVEISRMDMIKLGRKYIPRFGVSAPLTLETVKAAVGANGAAKIAVLVYNPVSYDGFRNKAEEKAIYDFCRENGILVIADFAWSPAYSLYPGSAAPLSLLDYCDICASSPHKKNLFLSPVSVILLKDAAMADRVTQAGRLGWMTTSPSFGLLQSVDFRLAEIERGETTRALSDVIEISQNLRRWFNQLSPHIRCVSPADIGADYQCPSHLLLSSKASGIDCREIGKWLSENALTDLEKTTEQTALYLIAPTHKPLQSRLIGDLAEAISIFNPARKERT